MSLLDDEIQKVFGPGVGRIKQARKAALPEEYDESLLSKITHTGLSGLSMAGNFLDLPGSSVRDVIAGENPLDQWAPWNWFSDKGRTTGRDLLRKGGFIGREDNWKNFLGGAAAEIALDPTTYFTFGASALSKAGKLAKAAGVLGDVTKLGKVGPRVGRMTSTLRDLVDAGIAKPEVLESAAKGLGHKLDDLMDVPLGGLAAPHGPFAFLGGETGVLGKAGGLGEKIAHGLDVTGRAISESPPGRFAAMLFDPAARGLYGKESQKLARTITQAHEGVRPDAAMEVFQQADVLDPALRELGGKHGTEIMEATRRQMVGPAERNVQGLSPDAPDKLVERAFSQFRDAKKAFDELDKAEHVAKISDELARSIGEVGIAKTLANFDIHVPEDSLKGIEEAVTKIKDANKSKLEIANQKGANLKALDEDAIGHLHRSVDISRLSWQNRQDIASALQREAAAMQMPVDKLPQDVVERVTKEVVPERNLYHLVGKTVTDTSRSREARTVPTKIVNDLLEDPAIRVRPGTKEGQQQAAQYILDNYAQHLDTGYQGRSKAEAAYNIASWSERNRGRPGFPAMLERQTQLFGTPDAKNAMEQHAWELAQYLRSQPRRTRYVKDVITDQMRYNEGITRKNATMDAVHEYLHQNASGEGIGVPLRQVFEDANMDPDKALDWFAKQGKINPQEVAGMNVPQDVANAVVATVRTQPNSEWGRVVGQTIDWVNDLVRANVTLPFPSFHARNLTSGQYINLSTGAIQSAADLSRYKEAVLDAQKLRTNPSDVRWREIEAYGVFGQKSGARHGRGGVVRGFDDVAPEAPDLPMFKNPLLQKAAETYQGAMNLGGKAMNWVEYNNRVPLYLYYRKKGYEPLQAALEVKKRQFDYQELTPAERTLFRRGFLFYSFTRKMAPLLAETLIQRPGGVLAQSIKQTGKAHDRQDRPVPGYIKETTAIPLGEDAEGNLRYLTGLGLPQEDVLAFGPSPLQELLSRTSPLIKAPIELATGQSMFQRGRPLDELDPSIGRTIANVKELAGGEPVKTRAKPFIHQGVEFLAANSPASRLLSTARTLSDPRKGLLGKAVNLATGARITDVSPAAQDAEMGLRAAEILKTLGARSFTKTYVPEDEKAALSPEDLRLLSGLELLQRQRAARARARR